MENPYHRDEPVTISSDTFAKRVCRLNSSDTLEIVADPSDPAICYIPYMMNDAVEDYLIVRTAQPGEDMDRLAEEMIEAPEHFRAWEVRRLYQYHRQGHYWVKGQEHLRRLVYQLGTICDKIRYLDGYVPSRLEERLGSLMGFGPLRSFSPIDENLDDWYEDSKAGAALMEEIAWQCHDEKLAWAVGSYRQLPNPDVSEYIAHHLASSAGWGVYQFINRNVIRASMPFGVRSFDAVTEEWAQMVREEIDRQLRLEGMVGNYPYYDSPDSTMHAYVAEEMPYAFRILEDPGMHYAFYVQWMVQEDSQMTVRVVKAAEELPGLREV